MHCRVSSAWLFALIAGLLLAAAPANAGDSIQRWLERMSRAVESLDYRGTLVHVRNGRVDTLRVIHRSDEDGVRERIVSIDGEPREILRKGGKVRCVLPGDQPVTLESHLTGRLLPALPVDRLLSPDSVYRISLGERERAAGMMARVLHIQPRDAYRYGSRLWLEEETAMLLRYAVIDHDGHQLQQVSFTALELGADIADSELEPEFIGQQTANASLEQIGQPLNDSATQSAPITPRVPRGFNLVHVGTGERTGGAEFEYLLYSDGMSSFSIYIEEAAENDSASRINSMGAVHVYTARSNGKLYTVVGEVPAATVEFVGRQLKHAERHRGRG